MDDGGADGLVVQLPYLPGGLDEFVESVIPELRRRGRTTQQYQEGALRDRLGLPRPVSTFA